MTNTTTEHADGYAAVAFYGNGPVCYAYGDTLAECQRAAQRRLRVRRDEYGRGLYRHIHWIPLTADDASECSSMLDAEPLR